MEINLNGGTKVCVEGEKKGAREWEKGERTSTHRDQINKWDHFGARPGPDAKLGRAVFSEIEISPSTGKPICFLDNSLLSVLLFEAIYAG